MRFDELVEAINAGEITDVAIIQTEHGCEIQVSNDEDDEGEFSDVLETSRGRTRVFANTDTAIRMIRDMGWEDKISLYDEDEDE
ncbi:MAG: hypothetical protein WCO47_11935 [Methylococcus sp.]